MITAKFAPQAKLKEIEIFDFKSYKEFFEFYLEYNPKGIIFAVKDDGCTI